MKMRDHDISYPRAMALHPDVRQEVIDTIIEIEQGFPATVKVRIVQGTRTKQEQDALYAQGRTKPGAIVTKAKFGQTFHGYGMAIDFAIMYDADGNGTFETLSWDTKKDFDRDGQKDWQEVVQAFKRKGWKWGGEFSSIKDDPHLEKTFGYTWQQLLAKYNSGKFITGTQFVVL